MSQTSFFIFTFKSLLGRLTKSGEAIEIILLILYQNRITF